MGSAAWSRPVDHYELLGVSPSATGEELRAAWRVLMSANHPDRMPAGAEQLAAAERTVRINEAYRVLADPLRREIYDRARAAAEGPRYAPPPYVGSIHLGVLEVQRLAIGVGIALGLMVLGAVLHADVMVGIGALLLPCCGVWFVIDELHRTDED